MQLNVSQNEQEITSPADNVAAFLLNPVAQSLMNSVSDGVLVIDASNRRVVAMNRTARELLDYREEDVVGCQCAEVMNSPACTLSCPLSAILDGRTEDAELDLYYRGRAGDRLLHARTRMILIRDSVGEPVAGIEIFSDSREVRRLQRSLRQRRSLRDMVGVSPAMQQLFDTVEQIAPYDIPVIIHGESGVGKELVASALHHYSKRVDESYRTLNCAVLSPELTASQLFGHRAGAFTGADRDRAGLLEEAHCGTLLLDEVSELSPEVQAQLLRALENGEIQRVGETKTRRVDVRILAATHRKLEQEVIAGRFREDLFYRLRGASLSIAPLRDRKEDIPPLVEHFLTAVSKEHDGTVTIAADAMAELERRSWPGNVRELKNVLRLAAIRACGGRIRPEHLAEHWDRAAAAPVAAGSERTLAQIEADAIRAALDAANGNMAEAARKLGVHRSTLWRKVKQARQA